MTIFKKGDGISRNNHPIDHRYYPDVLEDLNFAEVEGDANIIDGTDVIFSPGHSPGRRSAFVYTSVGRAIITGFCCNNKNFPKAVPAVPSGVRIVPIEPMTASRS